MIQNLYKNISKHLQLIKVTKYQQNIIFYTLWTNWLKARFRIELKILFFKISKLKIYWYNSLKTAEWEISFCVPVL